MLRSGGSAKGGSAKGFTLVELMVTLSVMSILLMIAVPSMRAFVRNSQVRAVGESLQNGLRQAQSESLRRSRQVVFALTDTAATGAAGLSAVANGRNWATATVTSLAGESAALIESGVLTDVATGVSIAGPAAVCFNAVGRLASNASTGIAGATCSTAAAPRYSVTLAGATKPLQVLVTLGGQVRLCDPSRVQSASRPEGCPA